MNVGDKVKFATGKAVGTVVAISPRFPEACVEWPSGRRFWIRTDWLIVVESAK